MRKMKRWLSFVMALILCMSIMLQVHAENLLFTESSQNAEETSYPDVHNYILNNLNQSYISTPKMRTLQMEQAMSELVDTEHTIAVKYTLADAAQCKQDMTIDGIFSNPEEASEIILGQYTSTSRVYMVSENSDYYVAFIDTTLINGTTTILDWIFAKNDATGSVIEEIQYDVKTGIAYIPKNLYLKDGTEVANAIQVQLLVAFDIQNSGKTKVDLIVENQNENIILAGISRIEAETLDITTTIPLTAPESANQISLENLTVYLNNKETPMVLKEGETASYNTMTGELTIVASPITLLSVKVVINNQTMSKLRAARAVNNPDDLAFLPGRLSNLDVSKISVGDLYKYTGGVSYCWPNDPETDPNKVVARETSKYCYGYINAPEVLYEYLAWTNGANWEGLDTLSNLSTTAYFTNVVDFPSTNTTINGVNSGLDWSGIEGVIINSNGDKHYRIGLMCSHVSKPVQVMGNSDWLGQIWFRVLAINTTASRPYIILGFCSAQKANQSGSGIYKLEIVPPEGYAKVQKISESPEMTVGNECYSFEGARFAVYSTLVLMDPYKVGELVADANGNTGTMRLKPGTYYIKEIQAPPGYALNSEVKKVTVTGGKTTTVQFADKPQMNPIDLLLQKTDAETNAALQGAEFEVKYYTGLWEKDIDPAALGKIPARTWTFKTDEKGICNYDAEHKISGDELYLMFTGEPALPLGTITIQETKAPEGYFMSEEIFVRQIIPEGKTENVNTYNPPEIVNHIMKLKLIKYQEGTVIPIPNAVFEYTKPDGSKENLKTDTNGIFIMKGLQLGIHRLKEISVMDGYEVNGNVIEFIVNTDYTIEFLSKIDAAKGNISFQVDEEGMIIVTVEDSLSPYDLIVHKENDKAVKLEGAEFTIYSDRTCKVKLMRGVTGEDGTVRFDHLKIKRKYYLVETKAPDGYRAPENLLGKPVVYEVFAESTPVKNQFVFYINKEQEDGVKFTGTKAEQEVNMSVVNRSGFRLPNTGSVWMLPVVFAGTILCICTLLKKKKK